MSFNLSYRTHHVPRLRLGLLAATICLAFVLPVACGTNVTDSVGGFTPAAGQDHQASGNLSLDQTGQVITLGDIVKDSASRIFKEYSPLAAYLGENLQGVGVARVDVVVAADLDELAEMVRSGLVDLYFGNTVNATIVASNSGAVPILRRWKRGIPESNSIFLVTADSGISSLDQLNGKTIAFQAPHSGAGYILPKVFLEQQGLEIRKLQAPDSYVGPGEIGYIHTGGERTSVELLTTGQVEATAFGNAAYSLFPDELTATLKIIARSQMLPKSLVYVRSGLDPEIVNKITEVMAALDQTEEGRTILASLNKTATFDAISTESEQQLENLKMLLDLVRSE